MRVIHVHGGNLYGGVETLLGTLAREGDACPALEQSFALCFEGRVKEELLTAGATVHTLGDVRVRSPLSVRRARAALDGVLRRERYDVAICHSSWSQSLFGPVARAAGVPLAFWMHAPADGTHWLERWARRTPPRLVICNSEFTARSAPRLYPRARVEVVYCPVAFAPEAAHASPSTRADVRAELATNESDVVIIQVSRMEAWKGHAAHLEALALLKDVPDWTCWIIGGAQRPVEAEYLEGLKQRASRLGIAGRVRFTGERADVPRLLAAADMFCQPNTGPEPFGLVFIEALMSGLPVVATGIGGAMEIVNDSCGLLVAPDDVSALASGMRQLIESPQRRAELSARSPARARELCDAPTQLARLHLLLDANARREVAA